MKKKFIICAVVAVVASLSAEVALASANHVQEVRRDLIGFRCCITMEAWWGIDSTAESWDMGTKTNPKIRLVQGETRCWSAVYEGSPVRGQRRAFREGQVELKR